jgi:hypothetical protein
MAIKLCIIKKIQYKLNLLLSDERPEIFAFWVTAQQVLRITWLLAEIQVWHSQNKRKVSTFGYDDALQFISHKQYYTPSHVV